MHNVWSAARSVLAVLAGIVALIVVAFAVEIPLHWLTLRLFPQTFPNAAALNASTGWMLSQMLYTVPALILGGYVAAWLAPRGPLTHAVAMAIVQELLTVLLIFNPPHPVPPWMWTLSLALTPPAIIYGGYLCNKVSAAASSVQASNPNLNAGGRSA